MENNTVEVVLRINAKQFERGIKNATRVYATTSQNIAGANATASSSMSGLTNRVIALGAAYLTVSNSIRLVKTLLSTGGNFESLRIQLETLTGSAQAGEEAFAWIKDFVKETPFGLDEVTKGFVKLKAFGLDPIDGTYQAIADQAAALGGSQETLNGLILGVGQAWAKQKLQGEEILQLVERGVPVWDLLAQATGKNALELQKLSEQGELGRDVIAALITEMGRGVGGAALKQVETWNGLVSNAQVEWQQFLDTIAQSGSLDFFKDELRDLLKEVERLAASGELQDYAKEVGEAIVNLSKALSSVVGFIVTFNDQIVLLAKVLVVSKLLGYASGLYSVAAGALAAGSATAKLTLATKLLKATATLGLTLVLDAAISKYLEWGEAANDSANSIDKSADKIITAQEKLRKENEKLKQSDIARALKKQADIHAEFADKIKQAKETETRAIKTELDNQLKAYDKHLKGLEDAKKRQVDIAKEFAKFIQEINTGAGGEIEQPDILDFASAITNARKALADGDYDGAIEGAEGLAEMIRAMRDNGTEAGIVLQGLAQQAANLANEAASKRVDQETGALEKAQQSIDKLVTRAEFLKHIELGFDQQLADKNLSEVQRFLQSKINQNPLLMSINLSAPDLKAAEGLLKQAGVSDFIPEEKEFTTETSPIVRSLQLDTREAEKQIDEITRRAAQPVTKKVFVNTDGTSFSDRQSGTNAVFKNEALRKGSRL